MWINEMLIGFGIAFLLVIVAVIIFEEGFARGWEKGFDESNEIYSELLDDIWGIEHQDAIVIKAEAGCPHAFGPQNKQCKIYGVCTREAKDCE